MADTRTLLNPEKSLERKQNQLDGNVDSKKSLLPGPLVRLIFGYCDIDRHDLSRKQSTLNLDEIYLELALSELLLHVVRGEQYEAKAIILKHPELLLKTGTTIDYSFRTLENVTPITAAYGADDVDMCEMMFQYLDKNSRDQAIHQIKDKFSEKKELKSYDFSRIVAAITANKNIDATLEQFRKDFKPGVIKKGKHFNMKILLDAYQAYDDKWDAWSGNQCSKFWREVIGYLQRSLPACYAQAYCQGLYHIADLGYRFRRNLKLNGKAFFYPDNPNLRSGLGFDFGAGAIAGVVATTIECRGGGRSLEKYVKQKQQGCESLCNDRTIGFTRSVR